jgi:glutamate N-acetyltransferase/amino-acid N-acetyltransferase
MAVGLSAPETILPVAGIKLAAMHAGIKKNGKPDLVIIQCDEGTRAAATFTRNAFCAAPVIVAREHLACHAPRALLINSGNANAGTGGQGLQDARTTCRYVADALQCDSGAILPFSTGVIGETLPMAVIDAGVKQLVGALDEANWLDAAHGIMTTDTLAKAVSRTLSIDGETITISGISKGSGMIRPDMATMLAFIATDADIEQSLLQKCLGDAVDISFNAITVDGDTSTNDACVLLATGRSKAGQIIDGDSLAAFKAALEDVCRQLAQAIVRDGEGATKFVTIDVRGANDDQEARLVAYTVAHSPLVKTALFASDPNWGRILAAVGRAGVDALDVSAVEIYLDDVCIVRGGGRADDYTEAAGKGIMDQQEITIGIVLGRGDHSAAIWTTDLSYDYVKINAEYRT